MPYQFGHAQGTPSNTGKLRFGSEVTIADFEMTGCEKSTVTILSL